MKKLQLKFKTADGKNKDLVLSYVKDGLDKDTVREAMNKIQASKLFEKNTYQLYNEILGAKYVDREESTIF
ncbi:MULTISPECIES: DUF2922 domain-containing protein [unclassified Companilactobacillus]|jgi:hypothetical protein|uniref:DUF2922 domain-containing protein n=1 Tax=unclassified Companilactobacillus TaxID=2767904 RepID=UPI002FEF6CA3